MLVVYAFCSARQINSHNLIGENGLDGENELPILSVKEAIKNPVIICSNEMEAQCVTHRPGAANLFCTGEKKGKWYFICDASFALYHKLLSDSQHY